MADLDLSLSDALTDSVPQPGQESLVQRDFVAQLESETFDDKVGETVGKTDYVPLLDNDDTRAGENYQWADPFFFLLTSGYNRYKGFFLLKHSHCCFEGHGMR